MTQSWSEESLLNNKNGDFWKLSKMYPFFLNLLEAIFDLIYICTKRLTPSKVLK